MADTNTTFDWVFDSVFATRPHWVVDGTAIPYVQRETRTPRTLTLEWRVTTDRLSDLRPLKPDEGQVATLTTDSGGYVAVDRADGGNTVTLDPPDVREPLRRTRDHHVQRYKEDLISQTADDWQVEIEFVPEGNRTDTPSISKPISGAAFDWTFDQAFERRSATAWGFTTRYGEFWTERVDAELLGTGEGGVERFELETRLTFEQARVYEAAFNRLAGTRIRQIPDAGNVAVDDTGGDMTVTVDSPDTSVVSDGDYVVLEWESTRISDAYQTLTTTIAAT